MIAINIATAVVDFFSFLALLSTHDSSDDFLGALFLFSASILLVGLSLCLDSSRPQSILYSLCSASLLAVGVLGIALPICATLVRIVEVKVVALDAQSADVIVKSSEKALLFVRDFSIRRYIYWGGLVSIVAPLVLAIRAWVLRRFRGSNYTLAKGYYRK